MIKFSKDSALLSKDVVQDIDSGLVSLLNLVDNFETDELPTNVGPVSLSAKFTAVGKPTKDSERVTLGIRNDKDEKVGNLADITVELPLNVSAAKQKTGILMTIPDLTIEKPGDYKIVVNHNSKTIADIDFNVALREEAS